MIPIPIPFKLIEPSCERKPGEYLLKLFRRRCAAIISSFKWHHPFFRAIRLSPFWADSALILFVAEFRTCTWYKWPSLPFANLMSCAEYQSHNIRSLCSPFIINPFFSRYRPYCFFPSSKHAPHTYDHNLLFANLITWRVSKSRKTTSSGVCFL